jgi:hypothetical protein
MSAIKKDYTIKFEKNYNGDKLIACRVTFKRPDGVQVKEILEALNSTSQEKLLEVYANGGSVMIFCQRGIPLTGIGLKWYLKTNYDYSIVKGAANV